MTPSALLRSVLATSAAAGTGALLLVGATVASASSNGQVVIGPQAMEGNMSIHPGDPIDGGFDFTIPGAHPSEKVTVTGATVRFLVTCPGGSTPAPIVLSIPDYSVSIGAGDSNWYPSGDQASSAVQTQMKATDQCGGQTMNDAKGAQFSATFSSTDTSDGIHVRFHYADPVGPSSWSATLDVMPAAPPSTPQTCPAGQTMGSNGQCGTPPAPCPTGQTMGSNGQCSIPPVPCPAGQTMGSNNQCSTPAVTCPAGQTMGSNNQCVLPASTTCPAGQTMGSNGQCTAPASTTTCPSGQLMGPTGTCTTPTSTTAGGVQGISLNAPATGSPLAIAAAVLLALAGIGFMLFSQVIAEFKRR